MMQENFLEQLPHAALEIRDGAVAAINTAAKAQLPSLALGSPVPDFLACSLSQGESAGSFDQGEKTFLFTRVPSSSSELILFSPAQSSCVNAAQLEGFSRQMREAMGSFFNQLQLLSGQLQDQAEPAAHLTQLNHDFHRILRLANNLEFLSIPESEAQFLFHPVTMDLAGLCMQLKRQAAPMLRKAGVELNYVSSCTGLLIPGDPELLQRMLLGLISNAAKAAPGGTVTLNLRLWLDQAILSVADSGDTPVDLSVLFRRDSAGEIPDPGAGAGMGLSVIRRIIALHGGKLFTHPGAKGGLVFVAALPTGPLRASLPLQTPGLEPDAGISPFLTELADILPAEVFLPDFD